MKLANKSVANVSAATGCLGVRARRIVGVESFVGVKFRWSEVCA